MCNDKELYGIEPMDVNEELVLFHVHPAMAKTRSSKIRLVTASKRIKATADYMEWYAKEIPVEDDMHHADLVRKLCEDIELFEKHLCEIINKDIYGGND